METYLQYSASILLIVVSVIYLKQTIKAESTPNPGTWIVWFIAMGINVCNYWEVVDQQPEKAGIAVIGFIGISSTMVYSLVKGKFAKLKLPEFISIGLVTVTVAYWILTRDSHNTAFFIQASLIVSFYPTAQGLIKNELKEKHWPWTLSVIAYGLQTLSLVINYNGNIYPILFPLINGVIGNGSILIIILFKKRIKRIKRSVN